MPSNFKVSNDVDTFLRSADNAAMRSNIGAASGSTVDGLVTDVATNTSNISTNTSNISTNTSNISTNTSNIATNTSNISTNTSNIATKAPSASPTFTGTTTAPTIITGEIQCVGTTTGTAEPINYDSNEHRFRDYDANPTDLLVIEKIDGYTGARVGINKDPSSSNAVALHVVAGKNASTNAEDLGLKVVGGAFFEDFIRVGHYTDETRDAITNPTNGTIIYNSEHHEYQGYVGGGSGWKKFTMGNVST